MLRNLPFLKRRELFDTVLRVGAFPMRDSVVTKAQRVEFSAFVNGDAQP